MTEQEQHWFQAKWPGKCTACGSKFDSGDSIRYKEGEIVAWDCCKGLGSQPEYGNVMPTGKTIKDRCPECFTIHAATQEECE